MPDYEPCLAYVPPPHCGELSQFDLAFPGSQVSLPFFQDLDRLLPLSETDVSSFDSDCRDTPPPKNPKFWFLYALGRPKVLVASLWILPSFR